MAAEKSHRPVKPRPLPGAHDASRHSAAERDSARLPEDNAATVSRVQRVIPLRQRDAARLQRIAGNRATTKLVQASAERVRAVPTPGAGMLVQRTPYNLKDGRTIYTEVTEGNGKIEVDGRLRVDRENTQALTGSVTFNVKTIPRSAVSSSLLAFGNVQAINIKVIQANPQGLGLGNLLMYHLALYARAQKIDYVIAGDVTDARGPYYIPLGFRDFLNAPGFAELEAEKSNIDARIRDQHAPVDGAELIRLTKRRQELIDLQDKNQIFIETDALAAATQAKWQRRWDPG